MVIAPLWVNILSANDLAQGLAGLMASSLS